MQIWQDATDQGMAKDRPQADQEGENVSSQTSAIFGHGDSETELRYRSGRELLA